MGNPKDDKMNANSGSSGTSTSSGTSGNTRDKSGGTPASGDDKTRGGGTGQTSNPPPPPPPGPTTLPALRVLTWNLFLLPDPVQDAAHNKRAELIRDYLGNLAADYDIICLVKAFEDRRRRVIVDGLSKFFPHRIDPLLAIPWRRIFGDYNSGISVLSKQPLTPILRHDWNAAAGTEASEPKGFIVVELAWQGQPVQLVVTHMQGHLKNDDKERQVRAAQMQELKAGLDSVRRANVTQVVCGDFAIRSLTGEYDLLRQELALDHAGANTNLWSTNEEMRKPFPNIRSKIDGTELSDYFFLRNSTQVEIANIQRDSLKNAWDNWLTFANPKDDPLSYKTPVTARIVLQPTAHRPAAPVDFTSGTGQRTYLSFIQEQPERTYSSFVYLPQNSAGMEYGLGELKSIVREAKAQGRVVRAMGSGHSFSHVARAAMTGKSAYLVDIGGGVGDVERRADSGINGIQLLVHTQARFNQSAVNAQVSAGNRLVEVGAGTTIRMLNEGLEKLGLGLINMGTYNGQTFAGASSTSTHGSGIGLPPFPDMIRSLVLVSTDASGNPRAYRIEPTNGITNASGFIPTEVDELIQNDDVFYSAICAMGSFGLLHSFILEVRPFYYLDESLDMLTWKELKAAGLVSLKKDVASQRHFELVVAPHTDSDVAIELAKYKNEIPLVRIRRNISSFSGERGLKRGCLFSLVELGNAIFTDEAVSYPKCYKSDYKTDLPPFPVGVEGKSFPFNLSNMVSPTGYTNRYYKVFRQGGHVIGGFAIELTAPIDKMFDVMDRILAVCALNKSRGMVHSSPIGVRFVAASKAYMSQFYGKESVTFEVTMLRGTPYGYQALKAVQDAFLSDPDVRMHWGLTMVPSGDGSGDPTETRTQDHWRSKFPKFDVWLQQYRRFNAHGLFSSRFTTWMGLEGNTQTSLPNPATSLWVLGHLEDVGDTQVQGEMFVGTRGKSKRLEGFQLTLSPSIPGLGLRYMGHVEAVGDTPWVTDGQFVGTRGQWKRLEGFCIELTGPNAALYKLSYMAHLEGVGDTPWMQAGQFCGTRGQSRRVEGMAVRLVKI